MKKNYINQTGDSNKFWTIEQMDNSYTVVWGKIGTEGRTNSKSFADSEACRKEVEKLIKEKINKGYQKQDDLTKVHEKPIEEYKAMNEAIFWEIIKLLNWDKTGNDDAVLRPALMRLASFSIEDICKFEDMLSEKLYMLDGLIYATNIGEESYKGADQPFSADYFLFVRCCVVANGKDYFNQVLANPKKMPKEMDFEALLYLPEQAYNKKTKTDDYDHIPKYNCETFSNKEAWKAKENKKPKLKFW